MNKRSALVITVIFCFALLSSAHAREMFETYPKNFALGYVEDQVNARYWVNPKWGVEMTAKLSDNTSTAKNDDGVVVATDRSSSHGYTVGFAAVRSLKSFDYLDLNLKAGFSYSSDTGKSDPEGPNNDSRLKSTITSLFIGPEVEIKVPYLSRLVIVSSVQAIYTDEKSRTTTNDIAGVVTSRVESKTFSFHGDGNSLHDFVHIGVRYYF